MTTIKNHNLSTVAYSMTKTFTAVAILQLVEQGKLRLNFNPNSELDKSKNPSVIAVYGSKEIAAIAKKSGSIAS
jgi:Beta-lactamase